MHCLAGGWARVIGRRGARPDDLPALVGRQEEAGAVGGLFIDDTLEGEALTGLGIDRAAGEKPGRRGESEFEATARSRFHTILGVEGEGIRKRNLNTAAAEYQVEIGEAEQGAGGGSEEGTDGLDRIGEASGEGLGREAGGLDPRRTGR